MKLQRTDSATEFISTELRERAQLCPGSVLTQFFKATVADGEIAFVAIDVWPDEDYIVLYEVFVQPKLRRQGHGTQIVKAVQDFAVALTKSRVILKPEPFDGSISKDALINWYRSLGYVPRPGAEWELEKKLQ